MQNIGVTGSDSDVAKNTPDGFLQETPSGLVDVTGKDVYVTKYTETDGVPQEGVNYPALVQNLWELDELKVLGIFPFYDEPPEVGKYMLITQAPVGEWQKVEDAYYVKYTIDDIDLESAKSICLESINYQRDAAFEAGLPYEIGGELDTVQTRLQDKINLIGLRMEARELELAGISDAVMAFRGFSNVGRELTPSEMVNLTNAALSYIQDIYKKSWDLKDAVNEAGTIEEVEAIQW